MSFIKIPNILFDYYEVESSSSGRKKAYQKIKYFNLEAIDLCVYVYFLSCGGFVDQNQIVRKSRTIAANCGIKDPKTVRNSISRLISNGLISKYNRFNQWGHFAANGYQITSLLDNGFFMFDTDYLRHELSIPEMCVLLYLNRCRNADNPLLSCPSISKICLALNLSKNTVRKGINQLIKKLFIQKENYISQQGDFGNNRYRLYSSSERTELLKPFRRFKKKITFRLKHLFYRLRNAIAVQSFFSLHFSRVFRCFSISFGVGQKFPNTS